MHTHPGEADQGTGTKRSTLCSSSMNIGVFTHRLLSVVHNNHTVDRIDVARKLCDLRTLIHELVASKPRPDTERTTPCMGLGRPHKISGFLFFMGLISALTKASLGGWSSTPSAPSSMLEIAGNLEAGLPLSN